MISPENKTLIILLLIGILMFGFGLWLLTEEPTPEGMIFIIWGGEIVVLIIVVKVTSWLNTRGDLNVRRSSS
jgi:hypothetical protein